MDDRLGAAKGVSFLAKKVFPDHWSFMLGEIAMYSMIVCLLTGAFLTFWFVPSASQVVYDGSYVPLQGVTMSDAYRSTLGISFDIRGGLLIRQIHHWAALVFVASVFVHMLACSSPARSASRARSTGCSARSCRCSPASRASPATRSPTTCSRAPACAP